MWRRGPIWLFWRLSECGETKGESSPVSLMDLRRHEEKSAGSGTLRVSKFKEFAELDGRFKKDLGTLKKAAEKGQKKVVKDQTHKLLDDCVVCHEGFRK